MKSEMSNNTLVVLLVGAMFVAMLGTLVSVNNLESYNAMLTGYAVNVTNPNATLNITVNGFAHINFTKATIEFGSGYAVGDGCDLYADGITPTADPDCMGDDWGFGAGAKDHLELENLGNINCTYVNITHNSSIDASVLIGGTSPVYEVGFSRENDASCTFAGDISGSCGNDNENQYGCNPDKNTMFVTGHNATVCNQFGYLSTMDELYLNFHLFVPTDATPGTRTDTWTAVCDYTA